MTLNYQYEEPGRYQTTPRIVPTNNYRPKHRDMAHVNVVVTQPGRSVWHFEHPWSHTLCSCCTDVKQCCYAFFCPCCFECQLFKRAGENMCACMCPGAKYALRSKIRTAFRIEGSLIDDCCVTTCCPFCAAVQLAQELNYQGL